jgi:uncharacterized protein YndB with AHSA1/START domain
VAQTETPAIIVETIVINAPATVVFAALTEPDELTKWWGSDESYHTDTMEVDLRPGGAWKTSGTQPQWQVLRVRRVPHRRCAEAP